MPDFITKHFLPMIEFLNQNDAKIEQLQASNLRLDAYIDELSETNSNLNLKLEEFSAKNASLLLKMTGSAILKG
jgi:predicted RNase H-like nuclease (RuvC/YqgF family)